MQNLANKSWFFHLKQVDISLPRSPTTQTSITPSFNNDRCIYTPSFTLPVDIVTHAFNLEILSRKCTVLEMPIRRKDSKKPDRNLQSNHPLTHITAHRSRTTFKILSNLPRKVRRLLHPHPTQNTWNQNVEFVKQWKDPRTMLRISNNTDRVDHQGENKEHQKRPTTRVEKSKRRQK